MNVEMDAPVEAGVSWNGACTESVSLKTLPNASCMRPARGTCRRCRPHDFLAVERDLAIVVTYDDNQPIRGSPLSQCSIFLACIAASNE